MDRILECENLLESCRAKCFTVVLFVFQFHPVFNLGEFINFGRALGTVKSERIKHQITNVLLLNNATPNISRIHTCGYYNAVATALICFKRVFQRTVLMFVA